MLINDITQRLNATSLLDEVPPPNAKSDKALTVETCQEQPPDCGTSSVSPLVRGSSSRLSLPFNTYSPRGAFQATESRDPPSTVDNDMDVEELPTKRRHLSWAAADFRLHSDIPLARRSETNCPDSVDLDVELVKPIPIRPVLAKAGSRSDCRDDSGLGSSKHTSFSPSVPRPSSASSGIFDLETSSECSKRDDDKLDCSVSNGWYSSADERRRSDEDSHLTATTATSSAQSKGHRNFVRHCRGGAHSRLSSSGGFFSLARRNGSCHDDNCDSDRPSSPSHNALTVPSSIVLSSSNKGNMSSSWWRSAPDLISGTFCPGCSHPGTEDETSCCRRHPRKRNLSGRLQPRPSIDLFKNVTDDDSSCGGESLVSSDAVDYIVGEGGKDTCADEFNATDRKVKEASNKGRRKGLEAEDASESDSDESNSLTASGRSTAGTFSIGSSSVHEPTPVTRSLSYPWLQSHDDLGDEHRSKNSDFPPVRRSVDVIGGGYRRIGRSANVTERLIEDGLRTIVGSPADTVAAVFSLSVRSNNSGFSTALPTTHLLNTMVDTMRTRKATADDDGEAKVHHQTTEFASETEQLNHSSSSPVLNHYEVSTVPLDAQLLDTPPQLIDGPVLFMARYNFQNELDIDLIEQN